MRQMNLACACACSKRMLVMHSYRMRFCISSTLKMTTRASTSNKLSAKYIPRKSTVHSCACAIIECHNLLWVLVAMQRSFIGFHTYHMYRLVVECEAKIVWRSSWWNRQFNRNWKRFKKRAKKCSTHWKWIESWCIAQRSKTNYCFGNYLKLCCFLNHFSDHRISKGVSCERKIGSRPSQKNDGPQNNKSDILSKHISRRSAVLHPASKRSPEDATEARGIRQCARCTT